MVRKYITLLIILCNITLFVVFLLSREASQQTMNGSSFVRSESSQSVLSVRGLTHMFEALPAKFLRPRSDTFNINDYVMQRNACVPLDDVFNCVNAKFRTVQFPMCIYQIYEDVWISKAIASDGLWESEHVEKVITELDKERMSGRVGFIDVGANLGSFTLAAAHLGFSVVAVEPTPKSVRRLMSSVIRGGVSHRVKLVSAAVSNTRETFYEKIDYSNQGRATLVNETECKDPNWSMVADRVNGFYTPYICDLNTPIHTVFLDDLLPLMRSYHKVVLKIDIEGHEYLALRKASKMFSSIDVVSVHMEWIFYKLMAQSNMTETQPVVDLMLDFFTSRHYIVEHGYGGASLDMRQWLDWPDDITWRKWKRPRHANNVHTTTSTSAPTQTVGNVVNSPRTLQPQPVYKLENNVVHAQRRDVHLELHSHKRFKLNDKI